MNKHTRECYFIRKSRLDAVPLLRTAVKQTFRHYKFNTKKKKLKQRDSDRGHLPSYGEPQRRQPFLPSLSSNSTQALQIGKLHSWQATNTSPFLLIPTCCPQVLQMGTPDSIISQDLDSKFSPFTLPPRF